MALTSVGITLAASGRRRRRDVAVLRALGLARSQLRLLVAGEASTFVLVVAALGLPLGIVAGRLAWRAAADGLGSEVGPVLPGLAILGATLGVLLLVNLYGQALAVVVGRRRPGGDLRAE
jgi:ABC-type antimicrobial peptide transport system permease subunit